MNWSKLTLRTCHRKENGGGNRAGGRSSSSSRPSPNESETFYLRARRSWKKKSVKNFSCRDSVKGQRRRWSDACLSQVWSSNKQTNRSGWVSALTFKKYLQRTACDLQTASWTHELFCLNCAKSKQTQSSSFTSVHRSLSSFLISSWYDRRRFTDLS